MAPRDEIISAADLAARLAEFDGWHGDTSGITKTYPIGYDNAVRAVAEIGTAAIELEHRPDLDIRWSGLTVHLTTHTAGDVVTELDMITVKRLEEIISKYPAA